jgi:hypothetical protein
MYTKDELRELKIAFWESFAAYCEVQPYLQGRKKIWILYDTKIKGVELKFDATRNGAYVILEINHRQEDLRLEMFEKLSWYKETLEKDFNDGLIWDICFVRETGKEVAEFILKKPALIFIAESIGANSFILWPKRCIYLNVTFLKLPII